MTYFIGTLRVILAAWILPTLAFAEQTVEGHVVNSVTGIGIPGVAINIDRAGETAYSATSDSQGRFRIEGVKDGSYTAFYFVYRFWPLGNFGGFSTLFQVTTGGERVRLEAKMEPIPSLSGRVLDGAGNPVPDAILWLVWGSSQCKLPSCASIIYHYKTDEKGGYNIPNLDPPGAWRMSATAPVSWKPPESRDDQRLGWAQTFYPGVAELQLAEKIPVRPGGDLWSLDIKLAAVPVYRIRGRVLDVRGDPVPKASVMLGRGFGPSLDQETKDDGTFEFGSVADDEWRLSASVNKEGVKLWASQRVYVKGDDLENVELRLAPPFSIRGKTLMEVPEGIPAAKPPDTQIELASSAALPSDPEDASIFTGEPDGKGDFTIQNIYPGQYLIRAFDKSPPAPYFLDSIRLGDRDALESDVPVLSGAQPLTVIYKLGGGAVQGTIESCGASHVLLIPQNPALRRRGDFGGTTNCAPNGRFEFRSVRPGEYYVLAIAVESSTPWYEAVFEAGLDDAALAQARRVTVRANESTSVEIRPITRQ